METPSPPNSNLSTKVPVSPENAEVADSNPVDLEKIFNRGGSAGELLIDGLHNLSLKLSEGQNAFIKQINSNDREALFTVNEKIAKLEAENLRGVSNERHKLNAARKKLNDLSSAILGDDPDMDNLKALEAWSATAQMAYGAGSTEGSKSIVQRTGEKMRTAKLRYKIALGIGITAAVAGATVLSGGFIAPALVGGGLRSLRSFLNAQGRKGLVQNKARNGALDAHESAIEAILSERNTGGNAAETIALAKSGAEGVGYVKMHLGKIGLALFKSAEKGTNPNNKGISDRLSAAKLGLSESGFATQEKGTGLEAALNGRNMERFSSFMTMLGVAGVALRFAGIIGHIEQAGASVAESASVAKSSLTPGMKSSEIIETLRSRGFSINNKGVLDFTDQGSAQKLKVTDIQKLINTEEGAGILNVLTKNPETAVAFSRFASPNLIDAKGGLDVNYLISRGIEVEDGAIKIKGNIYKIEDLKVALNQGLVDDNAIVGAVEGNIEQLNRLHLGMQAPRVNVVGDSVLWQSEDAVKNSMIDRGMMATVKGSPGSSMIDHIEYDAEGKAVRIMGNPDIEEAILKGDPDNKDVLVIASGTNEQSLLDGDSGPTGYGTKIDPSVIDNARDSIVERATAKGYDSVVFTDSVSHRPGPANVINEQLDALADSNPRVTIAGVSDIWNNREYLGGKTANPALDGVHFNDGEKGNLGRSEFANRITGSASASEYLIRREGSYDYASSRLIMPNGEERMYWGTGGKELKDRIVYSVRKKGEDKWSEPITVLEPGVNDWSLTYVNDPSVIFNEAGYEYNGDKYPFMMHYTTTSGDNTGNVIGVAYSKDGVKWERYDKPVIKPLNEGHIAHDGKLSYGVGQTSALKLPDGRTLVMYTDLTRERADGYDGRIVISSTTDGINFKELGEVSTEGAPAVWNNDFAISQDGKFITAAMPLGNWTENDEVGSFGIFKMPTEDFLTGNGHWKKIGEINEGITGNAGNHSPDITTLSDGTMPSSDEIEVTYASGTGGPMNWDLRDNKILTR